MATAAPAGYSGKQLWQKLGLKEGQRLFVADAPPALPQLLAGAPKGVVRLARFAEYDIDLQTFVQEIVLPDCPPPFFALGHSMGAAVLLRAE